MLGKRELKTVAVTVKMSPRELQELEQTAERLWPGADMSRPAKILSLARLAMKKTDHGKLDGEQKFE